MSRSNHGLTSPAAAATAAAARQEFPACPFQCAGLAGRLLGNPAAHTAELTALVSACVWHVAEAAHADSEQSAPEDGVPGDQMVAEEWTVLLRIVVLQCLPWSDVVQVSR